MDIIYRPIGIIRSPFKTISDMPVQPVSDASANGFVEIDPQYQEGLCDVEGFSHLILIYHFHRAQPSKLSVLPFLDACPRGVFSTRAPSRPNPIGLSIVGLHGINKNCLSVTQLDILDDTPLLDIKPYVPEFDARPEAYGGWFECSRGAARKKLSDNRFE
jgi:tRNA-Thr(GGU) m(6)t(6)A37 methyltransferase TsaA